MDRLRSFTHRSPTFWQVCGVAGAFVGCAPGGSVTEPEVTKDTRRAACRLVPEILGYSKLLEASWMAPFLDRHTRFAEHGDRPIEPITRRLLEKRMRDRVPQYRGIDVWCLVPESDLSSAATDRAGTDPYWEDCQAIATVAVPHAEYYLYDVEYLVSTKANSDGTLVRCIHEEYQDLSYRQRKYCGFSVTPAVQSIGFWDQQLNELVRLSRDGAWKIHRAITPHPRSALEIGSFAILRDAASCECFEQYRESRSTYKVFAERVLRTPLWTSPL